MLTVAEYAGKVGFNVKTVQEWCRKGLLPGACKTKVKRNRVYMIPEDAPIPKRKPNHPPAKCKRPEPAKPIRKTYTQQEMCGFIAQNCGKMTYGQISRELGIPTLEVRRIYDHLHEAYGI